MMKIKKGKLCSINPLNKMKTNFKTGILIILLIAVIQSCSRSKNSDKKNENNNANIEISKVELIQPENSLTFPGELESFYGTDIFPKINSYVKRIYVDIGDKVKTGQLLVDLEAPEIEGALAESFSKMRSADATYQATLANYKRLLQTNQTPGTVSGNDLDYSKAKMLSDSLQVVAAASHYDAFKRTATYLKIIAPFDGIITDRQLAPGAFVGPGERAMVPVLKIKNENMLRLHIAIPEKYVGEIKEGEKIDFTVKSFPKTIFIGKIDRLSKDIDRKTRSEIIEILINNNKGKLMSGMYATVNIPIQRKEKSLYVPFSSVVTNMEKCFVIKIDRNKKVHWVNVQTGNKIGDKIEVFGDLNENDTILKQGNEEIKEGTLIN